MKKKWEKNKIKVFLIFLNIFHVKNMLQMTRFWFMSNRRFSKFSNKDFRGFSRILVPNIQSKVLHKFAFISIYKKSKFLVILTS